MGKLTILLFLMFLSFTATSQEKLSKKELRQQRKTLKLKEQHLELIESVKDSTWGFFPYSIQSSVKSGDAGGMFTFSDMQMTLFNVFIPDAKNVDKSKRIPSYDAKVLNYNFEVDDMEKIQLFLIFNYKGTNYSFLLEKLKDEKWATLKLMENSRLLGTYKGPLKE